MKTNLFIRIVLEGMSEFSSDQGMKILNDCGKKCFQLTDMEDNIKNKLKENEPLKSKKEVVEFIKTHVFPSFPCELKNEGIELTYDVADCICPLVKEHNIGSPFLCNCTLGFVKRLFETVTGKEVFVQLIDSFLRDGKPCKTRVTW